MKGADLYDDPDFLAGYRELRRSGLGLNEVLEIPAVDALLPPVGGLRVADLGCGEGSLAVRLAESGAQVVAVDASAAMLANARPHPGVRYIRCDLAELELPADSIDLVVSSLALHYVEDFSGLVRRVAAWLVPGGQFVFSVEHPVVTAPVKQADLVVDDYADEGQRQRQWFVDGVVKYHRTIGSTLEALLSAGFTVQAVREPQPTAEQVRRSPHLVLHRRRPPLLVVSARG
ncbi:Methyltransferase type 11 [Kribbella flavida DSM 17836]|uniref:Methyltransferase type 11 n=1 Tax=Kribbella flavida (strain DSM 17836 / JCM 10339 / NBRC 14399) TaxID=479435 RepID=D2PTC3_KRIFD|nr:Methyltransferase type 11 [Kribbella flavida DSM 17836]